MNNIPFLQTKFWAEFKGNHGWKPYYFTYQNGILNEDQEYCSVPAEGQIKFALLLRTFSLLELKKLSIAYIPLAPNFPGLDQNKSEEYFLNIESITRDLKKFLPQNTICIRYDIPFDFYSPDERDNFNKDAINYLKSKKSIISKTAVDIQPPDTTILDLSKSEDQLLADMKTKWRYNVKLAERKGVQIECFTKDNAGWENALDIFYQLFEITGKRDGISPHAKSYYKDLLCRNSSENIQVRLYLSKHENDYLAGIITLFSNNDAVYLYGASNNIKRNLMSTYFLQWQAIKDAKKFGSRTYDFYGMPPREDPNHPMHGLYLFKTGFGGQNIHRPGSYDAKLNSTYNLYVIAEKFRAWYHKVFLKKLKGR